MTQAANCFFTPSHPTRGSNARAPRHARSHARAHGKTISSARARTHSRSRSPSLPLVGAALVRPASPPHRSPPHNTPERGTTRKQQNNYLQSVHTLLLQWFPACQLPGLTIIMVSCFPAPWTYYYNSFLLSKELQNRKPV